MATETLVTRLDPHAHLRGFEEAYKATIRSETLAALAGGVTYVGAMGNTRPPIIDREMVNKFRAVVGRQAACDVGLHFVGTGEGSKLLPQLSREGKLMAVKVYRDKTHGYGQIFINNDDEFIEILMNCPSELPMILHAEGDTFAKSIEIAERVRPGDLDIHLAHISTAEEVRILKAARGRGILRRVTAGVGMHHLDFTQADEPYMQAKAKMRPPLGTSHDRDVVRDETFKAGGAIDAIESDHAPHPEKKIPVETEEELEKAPNGVPGLQETYGLLLMEVRQGRLSLVRLENLVHHNPRDIFRIPTQDHDQSYVRVDLNQTFIIDDSQMLSRCGWTPYTGRRAVQIDTIYKGVLVSRNGEIIGHPRGGNVSPLAT